MPRPLAEYGLRDWLRARPLAHAFKSWRYRLVTEAYLQRRAGRGDLALLAAQIRGRRTLVTIAFDDAEIVAWQIRAMHCFAPGVLHLVADNSRDAAASAAIEDLCASSRVGYLRLPPNPWSGRSPSRSHGLALNWVWRRLILPGEPELFGFIDHDLIPVAPCDPFEALARQPVGGDKRWSGKRWFLWAGYCVFRFDFMRAAAPDFGQDWFIGLDTGGGNWARVYSRLDPAAIEQRPIEAIAALPDQPLRDCYFERRGAWLHEVGLDGRADLRPLKRRRFLQLVEAALSAASADPA